MHPLIDVQDLQVRFGAHAAPTLKGISFQLHQGECLALVGESG
ncbi:dipeptide ABC transporter ATP-binding protein DppD, partial [Pseudomonas sp. MAFF212428]|nr:dipeptide ABC transporter ATP-binding protein DppD [Pseudomonas brassicae]